MQVQQWMHSLLHRSLKRITNMKQYQIKVYDKALNYKSTINPWKIMSEISFTNTMNGWQWNMTIQLDMDFDDTTYVLSDIARVYIYDDNNNGTLIYSWFVSKVNRIQTSNRQNIELELIGLSWLLAKYYVSWVRNEDPSKTIRDFVDWFNTNFWVNIFSYDVSSIVDYWTVTNTDIWKTDCLSAIKTIAGLTNFYRYIWADGKVIFNPKPSTISHYFTNQKDIESVTVYENMEEVVNNLIVERNWWAMKTYTDAPSIVTYWVKEKYMSKTDLLDETTQDNYWSNYISEYKDLRKETKIVVNTKYDIESIIVGEIFKVRNFWYLIDDLQIIQTQYRKNNITLTVEKKTSFVDMVLWD